MADQWEKLHDGLTYKVFKTDDRIFRYVVTKPNGSVLTSANTQWGARWAIWRDIRKGGRPHWWDAPIVNEVAPGGED